MVRERLSGLPSGSCVASNAADFDDLLLHVATILRDNPEVRAGLDERYRFILVDEYQDTNLAQYAIARALSIDHPNLAVTGDPDQSIYGWRGANLNNILEFERDFPEVHVVRLEQNYRSTQRILRVAAELIAHNVRRKEKGLFTENGPGVPVRLVTYATQKDEADGIAAGSPPKSTAAAAGPRDFAVFYRVNALSRAFEFALRELGVPYQMVNGLEFFQRKEIKDILAYLHLLNNPQRRGGLAAGDQHAAARHRQDHDRPALGLRRRARADAVGRGPRRLGEIEVDRSAARRALLGRNSSRCSIAWRRPSSGPVEEILGLVLSETGYQQQLRESERRGGPGAAGQHRGTAHRGPRFRRAARRPGATGGVPGRDLPGQRHGRLGDRRRPRDADDAARLEGAGVSGGLS